MNFLSLVYAVFLLSVGAIYWAAPRQQWRLWALLAASAVFYASLDTGRTLPWQVYYLPLLFAIVLVNFRLALELGEDATLRPHATDAQLSNEDWLFAQQDWNRRRIKILWFGIVVDVLLLLGFKYVPFLLASIGTLVRWPALQDLAIQTDTSLVAPLALSYFCFECIAYLVDVYRGAPAAQKLLPFAAYKLFFPKLLSGPITRYHQWTAQLNVLKFPATDQIAEGLWLIATGAVKKALLADNLGLVVDGIFNNLLRAGSGDLWLATFAYGLQLYLDFSGYVDMARGSAILLGFNLPQNFDFPYFSTNIADFWRRWHITLGDWLRNYLYFPLGGSRQGLRRTCLNLLIIMLVAGIWHGAAWGFVVWGGIHGIALVAHRLTAELPKHPALEARRQLFEGWWQSWPGIVVAWVLTQSTVWFAWIFFRLPNLRESLWVVQHLWGHSADVQFAPKVYGELIGLYPWQIAPILGAIAVLMAAIYAANRALKLQLNWPIKIFLIPLCLYIVWQLAPSENLTYIYFDF